MKITKALLLSAAIIASACSDDDENKAKPSNLETVKVSFASDENVIEAPAGLKNSDDEYAMLANSWVDAANGLRGYFALLQAPAGAKKSTSRITAANGRSKESSEVLVYTWDDPEEGFTFAYQVSQSSDKNLFEIFVKETGGDWLKYFHVEEKNDGSQGVLKLFDIEGEDPSNVAFTYEWMRANGNLTLKLADSSDESLVVVTLNETTGAGSVEHFEGDNQLYEMTWDAEGNGEWAYYEEGEVVENGTWEA